MAGEVRYYSVEEARRVEAARVRLAFSERAQSILEAELAEERRRREAAEREREAAKRERVELRGRLEAERRWVERVDPPQTPAPAQETRKPAPRAPEFGTDAAGEALSGNPRRGGGAASELKEVVREMSVADETRRLAWIVLQTANRTQAKGSSVSLVVPSAPEVTVELEPPLRDAELLEVEEYRLERGHVAPDDIGLRWGTYTITPAEFYFLEGGLPEPKDSLRELAKKPGGAR